MIMNKKRKFCDILKVYVIGVVLLFFSIYILLNNKFNNIYFLNSIFFVLIGLFSFVLLIREVLRYSYSLTMMHWFFCLIFYGIAGFVQYLNGSFVYSLHLHEDKLLNILIITVIWMLFYYIATRVSNKITYNEKRLKLENLINKKMKYNYSFVIFSTIASVLISFFIINQAGLQSIFSRATAGSAFTQETKAGKLLFIAFMRNIVVYGLAISIIYNRKYRKGKFLLLIQLLCCFIVNSPFGLARYNVAIVYIGLLLLMFPSFKRNNKFIIIFFFGVIVLFPMINVFRNSSLNEISFDILTDTMDDISKNFLHGDYDALSMIINTKNHIDLYGITYGYQLLGPLLFFIPRSLWSNKPLGSGHVVRYAQGAIHTNVSSPLIAEGLINFGFVGVILFSYIFGKITSYIDKIYWQISMENDYSDTFIEILYPFLLSMFFFMCRGDLMSTFSYSVSHIAIYTFMFWLNNIFC